MLWKTELLECYKLQKRKGISILMCKIIVLKTNGRSEMKTIQDFCNFYGKSFRFAKALENF